MQTCEEPHASWGCKLHHIQQGRRVGRLHNSRKLSCCIRHMWMANYADTIFRSMFPAHFPQRNAFSSYLNRTQYEAGYRRVFAQFGWKKMKGTTLGHTAYTCSVWRLINWTEQCYCQPYPCIDFAFDNGYPWDCFISFHYKQSHDRCLTSFRASKRERERYITRKPLSTDRRCAALLHLMLC